MISRYGHMRVIYLELMIGIPVHSDLLLVNALFTDWGWTHILCDCMICFGSWKVSDECWLLVRYYVHGIQ